MSAFMGEFPGSFVPDAPKKTIEVKQDPKQLSVVLEFTTEEGTHQALYRPEKGVRFQIDTRIPKPQELYRDVAFSRVDRLLGWNVSPNVIPWQYSETNKGVLRPYWQKVTGMEYYHFKRELLEQDPFWQKVAVLDYLCAVIDRTYNDVLILDQETKQRVVVDSGLSFVPGTEFVTQQSLIREVLAGQLLTEKVFTDVANLNEEQVREQLQDLVPEPEIEWIFRRREQLLAKCQVI